MSEANKASARQFYDALNSHNLAIIDEVVTPDFVEHEEIPGLGNDKEAVKQFFQMTIAAFPDFKMTIEDMIAEGDKVFVRALMTGTHRGDYMGIPATGKTISVPVGDFVRFSGDKVAEHWGVTDTGAMMQQLGVAGS